VSARLNELSRYAGPRNETYRDGLPYATPVATIGRAIIFVTATEKVVVEYAGPRTIAVDNVVRHSGKVYWDNPERIPQYVRDAVEKHFDRIVALRRIHV
jgi:hypothetical protein